MQHTGLFGMGCFALLLCSLPAPLLLLRVDAALCPADSQNDGFIITASNAHVLTSPTPSFLNPNTASFSVEGW